MEAGNEVGSNLKSIFYRVDSDRNGLIDIKELYNALKQSNENDFNPETCQLLMGKNCLHFFNLTNHNIVNCNLRNVKSLRNVSLWRRCMKNI